MAPKSGASRRGKRLEAGQAFRGAQRGKRLEESGAIPVPKAPDLSSKKKRTKKLRQRQDVLSDRAQSTTTAVEPDNKRALEEASQRPSKKIKTTDTTYTKGDNDLPAIEDLTTEDEPPLSFTDDSGIDPKAFNNLASAYKITHVPIKSSSKIQHSVTKILDILAAFSFAGPAKPNIVLLHARSPAVQKLISVVEIAKRDISKAGGKFYQYNRLNSTVVELERKSGAKIAELPDFGRTLGRDPNAEVEDGTEEESGFETMQLPIERAIESKPIKRIVPGLIIFLSRVRIESLTSLYNEQSNDVSLVPLHT